MKSLKKTVRSRKSSLAEFKSVWTHFLGNKKAENYENLVGDMVKCFRVIGCNIALLNSHLDFFSQNVVAITDEHGERFQQNISMFEKRFNGR
ncbi:hypothetical protein AVEN_272040-1 [Araneus ventricosus]|uniref:Uncharacterized protein n=1 Tax=Araneus ventricosus TaxID=182803 RepID=A0A4Y2LMJ9_ARAVE|nr:hypothetical protein AVEN_272040-1 [Araneus ventricosus]